MSSSSSDPSSSSQQILSAPKESSKHFSIGVSLPIYSLGFVSDTKVVLGGGGGSSRSGVKNRLVSYEVRIPERQLRLIDQYEFPAGEDTPMSLALRQQPPELEEEGVFIKEAVAGVNGLESDMEQGINKNLRVFDYGVDGFQERTALQILHHISPEHYLKTLAFSRSGDLLAIGGTNSQLSLLHYPSLEKVWDPPPPDYKPSSGKGDEEIYSVDFDDSGSRLLGASSSQLLVWSTTPDENGKAKQAQKISKPFISANLSTSIRAAKFGRKSTSTNIYTIVNAVPTFSSRNRRTKQSRKAFLSIWDTKTWKMTKTRMISPKPLTSFEISNDGELLAYGSSDLSVGIVNATNLRPLQTILHAHSFPVTALAFNPSASILVSGSADNSVRVLSVNRKGDGASSFFMVFLTILIILIAVLAQLYAKDAWDVAAQHLHL